MVLVLNTADDRPIVGARVTAYDAFALGSGGAGPSETETGVSGRCLLRVAQSTESMRLKIEQPGFSHLDADFECRPELTLSLSPASRLSGRVLDAETKDPVPGVHVRHLHGSCKRCEPDLAVTDGNGRYEFPAVPRQGEVTFLLEAEGFPSQHCVLETLELDRDVGPDLYLERGIELTGRVTDLTSGAGLAGAKVGHRLQTDASGAFHGRVLRPAGEDALELVVEAEGYATLIARLDQPPGPGPLEFRLVRGATVEGTVKDRRGLPIPGAAVRLEQDYRATSEHMPESPLALPLGWRLRPEGFQSHARTDERGRFSIRSAVPWSSGMKLSVVADGHARALQAIESLPGPGQSTHLDLVLEATQPGVILRGKILVNGQEYRHAQGRVRWQGASQEGEQEIYMGRFAANVEPGALALDVEIQGLPTALDGLASRLYVAPARTLDHVLDIRVPARPIKGRVTFEDGAAAPGVYLIATLASQEDGSDDGDGLRVSGRTAEDGSYSLDVPDLQDTYRIVASLDGDERSVGGVRAGSGGVDIALARAGVLEVCFRNAGSDSLLPARRFELRWRRAGEASFRSIDPGQQSAPDRGDWLDVRLPRGRVDLVASDPMHGEFASTSARDVLIQAHEPQRLELVMVAARSVELVLDKGQEPLPRSYTVLLVESGLWGDVHYLPFERAWDGGQLGSALMNRFVRFSNDGRATIHGLGIGSYRFRVQPDDIEFVPREILLGEPTSEPVRMQWHRR